MAFRHILEKAEWRNDAFRYFPPLSAAFRQIYVNISVRRNQWLV